MVGINVADLAAAAPPRRARLVAALTREQPSPRIGVLALQGDVREHSRCSTALGADAVPSAARGARGVDGLVIPGGESSVIDKLSRAFGLREPLRSAIAAGMPIYGTCAGLIMLADRIIDGIAGQQTFGGLDVDGARNAFGRQVDSFETDLDVAGLGRAAGPRGVHPRAARGGRRRAMSSAARAALGRRSRRRRSAGDLLGTSFHPEVTGEHRFHELFLETVRAA